MATPPSIAALLDYSNYALRMTLYSMYHTIHQGHTDTQTWHHAMVAAHLMVAAQRGQTQAPKMNQTRRKVIRYLVYPVNPNSTKCIP